MLSLGSSLNALSRNKKISSITQMGDVSSDAIRLAHDRLWDEAQPIEPAGPSEPVDRPDGEAP